jgi:hypothetical protein
MIRIFRKRNKQHAFLPIKEGLRNAIKNGESSIQVNIYVDKQILFQVVPVQPYFKRGITEQEGFIEAHFFNKNKTLTLQNENKLAERAKKGDFIHYEDSKGWQFYIKWIGKNPAEIEKIINFRLKEIYINIEFSRLSFEVVAY